MQPNAFFYRVLRSPVLTLLTGLLLLNATGFAQNYFVPDELVFKAVEIQPEFPGGLVALGNYMQQHVKYPLEAQKAGIKDRVYVNFIVERDGSLTDIQLLNSLGYGCDEEARRVIRAMPKWKPGKQSGRAVRVRFNMPILFGMSLIDVNKR
ncbi:energy transducer TonB [Spirosoma spitsbergense]|uniref:energy transducer TonB n=1 Tax=Spirosoma spitsbergense TaxID=431554 RepID=UPI00036C9382|nr:energy transducer TonB [Spirosoma spitsbergense]